jgi:hypothetical protein
MNRWCAENYAKTPHYVGVSYLEQYPGIKRALFFITTHVISDIYLGMVRLGWATILMIVAMPTCNTHAAQFF